MKSSPLPGPKPAQFSTVACPRAPWPALLPPTARAHWSGRSRVRLGHLRVGPICHPRFTSARFPFVPLPVGPIYQVRLPRVRPKQTPRDCYWDSRSSREGGRVRRAHNDCRNPRDFLDPSRPRTPPRGKLGGVCGLNREQMGAEIAEARPTAP